MWRPAPLMTLCLVFRAEARRLAAVVFAFARLYVAAQAALEPAPTASLVPAEMRGIDYAPLSSIR